MLVLFSRTTTRRPRLPASTAHIRPAAPAPITTTSNEKTDTRLIFDDGRWYSDEESGVADEPENSPADGGWRRQLRGSLCLPAISGGPLGAGAGGAFAADASLDDSRPGAGMVHLRGTAGPFDGRGRGDHSGGGQGLC